MLAEPTTCNSLYFNRLGLEARHFNPPKSHHTVIKMVKQYAAEIKSMNKDIIARSVKNGYRFSVTLDEYTRPGNRKLCNVNLHLPDSDFLRIGMIRVRGKMPAEVGKDILMKKLSEYGINLEKHVVCHTTDGASVMKRMGKLLKILHQICLSHGMHLAVCDTLYKSKITDKREDIDENEEEEEKDEEMEEDEEIEED